MHKHIVLAILLAVATQDALAEESRNSIGAELADDSRAGSFPSTSWPPYG